MHVRSLLSFRCSGFFCASMHLPPTAAPTRRGGFRLEIAPIHHSPRPDSWTVSLTVRRLTTTGTRRMLQSRPCATNQYRHTPMSYGHGGRYCRRFVGHVAASFCPFCVGNRPSTGEGREPMRIEGPVLPEVRCRRRPTGAHESTEPRRLGERRQPAELRHGDSFCGPGSLKGSRPNRTGACARLNQQRRPSACCATFAAWWGGEGARPFLEGESADTLRAGHLDGLNAAFEAVQQAVESLSGGAHPF
jgi:hypothetical protein